MFEALKEYKNNHGHCNVPQHWSENKQIGLWVSRQRCNYRSKKLTKDRVRRLEDIGFVWGKLESQWEEMFVALSEYKNNHGNCNVPYGYVANNLKLGTWVRVQREANRDKRISCDRIKQLEEIGFTWDPLESNWEEAFDALKEYKNNHGNCNVPGGYVADNLKLGQWVYVQRRGYRKERLSDDRIKRLEDIGFEWNIHKG